MSKRVHFAATNRIYSPIPSTPSPCGSTSSLPSSPDIPTPPPELELDDGNQYPRSPYPHDFDIYPELEPKDMHIHGDLAYTPYGDPVIPYDLSLDIALVKEQFSQQARFEPATHPPLQYITIVCPEYLQWDIPVKATTVYPDPYVSVDDILTAVYMSLRLPVNRNEYDKLGIAKLAVDTAYFARLSRIMDPVRREQEAAKGVKRVDFLMGRNRFMGLSVSPKGSDIWELSVD